MKRVFGALFVVIGIFDFSYGLIMVSESRSRAWVVFAFGILFIFLGLVLFLTSNRRKKQ